MKLPIIQLMDRSSQVVSSIGKAIHFVSLRQPQNRAGRYAANAARLLYLANVVVGLSGSVILTLNDLHKEKRVRWKFAPRNIIWSITPGLGFIVGLISLVFFEKK